jgi:orotate phosphoribosyltransferase
LPNGARSYFDKYLFESDPRLLREITERAAALIPPEAEVIAGLELGGVPIATALSLTTGIPAVFVRKEAKAYGTKKLAEGIDMENRHTLIVKDVITTGGQVAASAAELRERGARIESVLCIIDRSHGTHPQLDRAACSVISLLTSEQLD